MRSCIVGIVLGSAMLVSNLAWAQDETSAQGEGTSQHDAASEVAVRDGAQPVPETGGTNPPAGPPADPVADIDDPNVVASPGARAPLPDVSQMIAYYEFSDGRSRARLGYFLLFAASIPLIISGSITLGIPAHDRVCNEDGEAACISGGITLGVGVISAAVSLALVITGNIKKNQFSRFVDWTRFDVGFVDTSPEK